MAATDRATWARPPGRRGPLRRSLMEAGFVAVLVLLGAVPATPAPQPAAGEWSLQQALALDGTWISALCSGPDEAGTSAALQRLKSRRAQVVEQRRRRARLASVSLEAVH